MKFRVKSQLESDAEAKKGILDDCGPSSMAACVSWVFKYTPGKDFSAADGVAAKAKATGKVEKQGVSDNGSSLGDLIKTARVLGAEARWAKDWNDVINSAKAGAAIGVWVEQPAGYPANLEVSEWHDKWKRWWWVKQKQPKRTYGHMTAAVYDPIDGWQWICPTRSGKGKEQFGVKIDEKILLILADSKRVSKKHVAPAFKHVIIVTAPKGWVAPAPVAQPVAPVAPAPVAAAPVAPAPQPAAPAASLPCPRCGGTGVVK
jgi:hypothetical protein